MIIEIVIRSLTATIWMFSWFGNVTKRDKSPGQRVFVSLPISFKPACVCEPVVIKRHADRDVMVSQEQRNSQRGVGTACQSRGGSHSQGCHWRKRLESCMETERDKDKRERERRRRRRINSRMRKRGRTGMRTRRERRKDGRGPRETGPEDRQQGRRR